MVVNQVNIEDRAVLEPKRDPPIRGNPNGPVAFAVALQRVQPAGSHAGSISAIAAMLCAECQAKSERNFL